MNLLNEPSVFTRERLCATIDAICADSLSTCYGEPDGWDEDYITLRLLNGLNALNGHQLKLGGELAVPLRFDAFKQKGADEYSRGDVAIVIARDDGDYGFYGVAYLEMKKRYLTGSQNFDAVSEEQVARITSNEPACVVGFYDYVSEPYAIGPARPIGDFRVAVLPSRQVLSRIRNVEDLLRHANSFGHQFVYRYIEGADLDLARSVPIALATARRAKYVARFSAGEGPYRLLQRYQAELERYDNVIDVMEMIHERDYSFENDLEQERNIDRGFELGF